MLSLVVVRDRNSKLEKKDMNIRLEFVCSVSGVVCISGMRVVNISICLYLSTVSIYLCFLQLTTYIQTDRQHACRKMSCVCRVRVCVVTSARLARWRVLYWRRGSGIGH